MHRQIRSLPSADILIHTGDITEHGTDEEFKDFDEWLGGYKTKFKQIIVICGNHDWHHTLEQVAKGALAPGDALHPMHMKKKMKNCMVLDHEAVSVMGLKIFGSPWVGFHAGVHTGRVAKTDAKPGRRMLWEKHCELTSSDTPHRFSEIPSGLDILLTHGPSPCIFDCVGAGHTWGSSPELGKAIERAKPRVHMHGHLHEQRGVWRRQSDGTYSGGVEYCIQPETKEPFETVGPPPSTYPCELVCNNAMSNHGGHERVKTSHLAGPPRVIVAERVNGTWSFSV